MTGEPEFESRMICELVGVGLEAKFFSCCDVGRQIVDVECVFGFERVFVDGVLVDFLLGFDGADFIGKDRTVEQGEFRIGFENPRTVDGIGI